MTPSLCCCTRRSKPCSGTRALPARAITEVIRTWPALDLSANTLRPFCEPTPGLRSRPLRLQWSHLLGRAISMSTAPRRLIAKPCGVDPERGPRMSAAQHREGQAIRRRSAAPRPRPGARIDLSAPARRRQTSRVTLLSTTLGRLAIDRSPPHRQTPATAGVIRLDHLDDRWPNSKHSATAPSWTR